MRGSRKGPYGLPSPAWNTSIWSPSATSTRACGTHAGEQFGVAAYGNADEMLDAEAPDGVVVAVPAHLNGRVALPILERGANTLVEKPPGMSVAETVSLRDAAERTGAKAMVGWQRRFHPIIVEVRQMIEARGPVTQIVGEFHKSITQLGATRALPGGAHGQHALRDAHTLHRPRQGHPPAPQTSPRSTPSSAAPSPPTRTCTPRWSSSRTAASPRSPPTTPPTPACSATRYTARTISAYAEGIQTAEVVADGGTIHLTSDGRGNDTVAQAQFFTDCLREDRPVDLPAANLDEAIKSMELAEAIQAGLRD